MPIHFSDFFTQWYNGLFTPKVQLAAGTAVAATVAIDQTTTGTTNAVHVLAAAGVGSLTETAPANDTASSGLNGRLQRVAQRLTSLIALLPTALGAGGGLKIDGSGTAVPVSGPLTDTQLRATAVSVSQGALQAGTDSVDAESPVTAITLYNLTLTNADTQYSQVLPATCRRIAFQCRTNAVVRWAFEANKVATPTAPYASLPAAWSYNSGPVRLTGATLYLASATAGVVVEIEAHS